MLRVFPWYDSIWLSQYATARAYLAEHHPHRVADLLTAALPPFNPGREAPAAVLGQDGQLYVLGGNAGGGGNGCGLATVETYDLARNSWSFVAQLSTRRAALAAAVGRGGIIYAIAGLADTCQFGSVLSSVEALDGGSGAWAPVAALPGGPRSSLAATFATGSIYVVGGADATGTYLSRVEAFEPGVAP